MLQKYMPAVLSAMLMGQTSLHGASAQCLNTWTLGVGSCSYVELVNELTTEMASNTDCVDTADDELKAIFGVDSTNAVREAVAKACGVADVTFEAITNEDHIWNKAYYDGGAAWNDERETVTADGIIQDRLATYPGTRIAQIHEDIAKSKGIEWPDRIDNFENCEIGAAMCCFVQDRQANDGDNNGNCATLYDENCIDANPADNVDICYVDMERAPTSSRTAEGFAIFDHEAEDDAHCHGLAWSADPTDVTARYKGNNLFYISMYDHFVQRGYVTNVPGAPMCGCVEKMPVVDRSDCTELAVTENDVSFTYATGEFSAEIGSVTIAFNSCQGINDTNNDLEAYYRRLVEDENVERSEEDLDEFSKHIVGEHYCREAIDSFLDSQDLIPRPKCRWSDPETCGCKEDLQRDYHGTQHVTATGLDCQRWDSQEPHAHGNTRRKKQDAYLSENFCRNPDNEPNGAWCYTTQEDTRWEYCGILNCGEEAENDDEDRLHNPACKASDPAECGCTENNTRQKDYRGEINTTENDLACQMWDMQTPHSHTRTAETYPNADLRSDYCRNPDNETGGAWCYTKDINVRWQYCGVPVCTAARALRG